MPLRPFTAAAIFLLATMGPAAAAAPDEPTGTAGSPGKPIVTFTRQNAFTIPFRIEPPKAPGQEPVEVQLHVSTNQAMTWELASRVKPAKGAFVFRAPHDGEYWYSIRTVDQQGITRPEGPLEPQLKVTVDTVSPRLDLSAFRGDAGEIVARWQAVDPHLKPGSFKLEYQINSAGPWERVAVEQPPDAMRHTLSGEATWWPKNAGDSIQVRAEVSDSSGNPAVSQAVVKAGRRAPARRSGTRATAADAAQPIADRAIHALAGRSLVARSAPARHAPHPDERAGDRSIAIPNGRRELAATTAWASAGRRLSARTCAAGDRAWTLASCPPASEREWSTRGRLSWNTKSSPSGPRALPKSRFGARATAAEPGRFSAWIPTIAAR